MVWPTDDAEMPSQVMVHANDRSHSKTGVPPVTLTAMCGETQRGGLFICRR